MTLHRTASLVVLSAILTAAPGCGKQATDTATASGEPVDETLQAGDYAFQTRAVDDACLSGALELLFMPEGPATPHEFEYLIAIPAEEDLPATYDVDFREPFVGMTVTVESAEAGALAIRGSVMDAVELGRQYGDCVVTMTVDIDLAPTGAESLTGEARIDLSNPRGTEELCPVFDADPCRVTLEVAAARASESR